MLLSVSVSCGHAYGGRPVAVRLGGRMGLIGGGPGARIGEGAGWAHGHGGGVLAGSATWHEATVDTDFWGAGFTISGTRASRGAER